MKKAFGLPQAIMIMLFIATVVVIGMKYSQVAVNHYSDTYIKEQAQLFMQNAKEWALYQISGHTRTANCWSNGTVNRNTLLSITDHVNFTATVTVESYYLLAGTADFAVCGATLREEIFTPQSHGMVKLHIVVTDSLGQVRLESRSIQRP